MSTHSEVEAFVRSFADSLSSDARTEIQHYLDHGEPEIAFEGLVLELGGQDVSPWQQPRAAWLSLAERLGLREESVLTGDLWGRLSSWLARHSTHEPRAEADQGHPAPAVDHIDQRLTAALAAAHVDGHWDTSPARLAAVTATLAVQDDADQGLLVERLVNIGGDPSHPVSVAVRKETGSVLRLGQGWEDFQRLTGKLTEALLMPTPPPVDLIGLASRLSGVEREALETMLGGASDTFRSTISDLEDLQSEAPGDQERAQASLQGLLKMLREHGLEVPDSVLSTPASAAAPDAEAGKAMLSEGLGLLKSLLDEPESASADAERYVKQMEERFSHLVPDSAETSETGLKAQIRASIAEALKDL